MPVVWFLVFGSAATVAVVAVVAVVAFVVAAGVAITINVVAIVGCGLIRCTWPLATGHRRARVSKQEWHRERVKE